MSNASEATDRLLAKLRAFVDELDADERQAFAALVGPGVALAYQDPDEVEGFATTWEPRRLPEHLAAMVREHDLRLEGL